MVIMLSRTAYEKSARFKDYKKVNESITAVLFNTIIYLLGSVNRFHEEFTYQKEFIEFISYLEKIALPEKNLMDRIHLIELKGAYDIRVGDKEDGIAKMKKAIQILNDLNSTKLANKMEQYLLQII